MGKRYVRLDIEYDTESGSPLWLPEHNIARILAEDMPYCRIIFSRSTAVREDLDRARVSRG